MDKVIFRMSHAGSCLRKLTAEYLNYEHEPDPEWLQDAAEEGKVHEQLVKDKLRSKGYSITNEQEEIIHETDSFKLIGHIDGKIMKDDMPLSVLEVKSMSQFEYDRWDKKQFDGFPQYYAQMCLYMTFTGLQQCFYAVKNRSNGHIDYRTFVRDINFYNTIIAIKLDLQRVVDHIEENVLIDALYDEDSIECKRCKYQYLCKTPKVYSEQDITMLTHAADIWRKGKALQDEGKALVDQARDIFDSHMNATNAKKLVFNGIAAQFITKKSETYDKTKLLTIFKADDLIPALKTKEWTELRMEDINEK